MVRRVLLIDLDVHQGNGSAKIFEADSRVQTYSQHCEGNLFSAREVSDLDVDVPVGCSDDEYLALLSAHHVWIVAQRDRRRHGNVVEDAVALAAVGKGVVSAASNVTGVSDAAAWPQDSVRRGDCPANGGECSVAVRLRPLESNPPVLFTRQCVCKVALHVVLCVNRCQIFDCSNRRLVETGLAARFKLSL